MYEMDYPEAARAIAVLLDRFCDKSLKYPDMIIDAARKASNRIDELESYIVYLKDKLDTIVE